MFLATVFSLFFMSQIMCDQTPPDGILQQQPQAGSSWLALSMLPTVVLSLATKANSNRNQITHVKNTSNHMLCQNISRDRRENKTLTARMYFVAKASLVPGPSVPHTCILSEWHCQQLCCLVRFTCYRHLAARICGVHITYTTIRG